MDNSQFKLRSEAVNNSAPPVDTMPPAGENDGNVVVTTLDPKPDPKPDVIVKDPTPDPVPTTQPEAAPSKSSEEAKKNCLYCSFEMAANLTIRWGIAIVLFALAYNLVKQYGSKAKASKAA